MEETPCMHTDWERLDPTALAAYIDHTILKPEATVADVRRICDEALGHRFASVCVNPSYIALVAELLEGSGVLPCCVVGFPFGSHTPQAKGAEAREAVEAGARELDMVLNVGAVKSGDWALVERDVNTVVEAAGDRAGVKVILETCLLTDEEKVRACVLCKAAGAAFVKTSTGYAAGGATAADVALMRRTVGEAMGVKASGGIRTYEDAVAMLRAGASRLGASAGIQIIAGPSRL